MKASGDFHRAMRAPVMGPRMRQLDAALLAGLFVVGAVLAGIILTRDKIVWVDLIYDDAYYYLGVARSMAQSGSSSFLPPLSTNGYQPLWLWLLSASGAAFGAGQAALAVQILVWTLTFVALFALVARRLHGRMWPALLVAAGFPDVMTMGMETVMMPFFVLLYFSARGTWQRGLLASAVVLTRLDALALVVFWDLWGLLASRRPRESGQAAPPQSGGLGHWLILGPVLIAYFAFNAITFGTPVPVSGVAKAVGNVVGENVFPAVLYLFAGRFAIPTALVMLTLPAIKTRTSGLQFRREIAVLLATTATCAGYYSLMSGWSVWAWYFWPVALLTYYVILEALQLARQIHAGEPRRAMVIVGLVLALITAAWTARVALGTGSHLFRIMRDAHDRQLRLDSFGRENVKLVNEIRAGLLPADAFIAVGDRAGSLGYFLGSGFRLFHTEGLVADIGYVKALRADAGPAYLAKFPIQYLIADRERYLTSATSPGVIGVAEPIQGWSSHVGPYLLCFDRAAVVQEARYNDQTRYILDFRRRVDCPADMRQTFVELRAGYGDLRAYSLPSEYLGGLRKWVHDIFHADVPRLEVPAEKPRLP